MGLSDIFESLRNDINKDTENAKAIAGAEEQLNSRLSETRFQLSKMLELTPLQLLNGYFTCFEPNTTDSSLDFTFPGAETEESNDGDLFLSRVVEDFIELKEGFDFSNYASGAKERLVNKLKEDTFFFLLAARYINSVAYYFKIHDTTDPLHVPLTTKNWNEDAGIVMKPDEMDELLEEHVVTHSPYLSALLELSEMLVDYTTNMIIKLSTDPDGDDALVKGQYSLALLNLSLLSHLQNGFQMLDLKNDGLRRKYDKLKYSVKKINGIVYDLSLRKLFPFKAEVTDR